MGSGILLQGFRINDQKLVCGPFYFCSGVLNGFAFCRNSVVKILSLTVVGRKNRCIPYIYWAAAIFIVVSNYSNLFLPFAFFLDCSHFTFGYELIVRPETAGFVKSIRNLFPLV